MQPAFLRPRRSMLFVPAGRPSAIAKAPSLAADAFIFDLEDSVLPEHKVQARQNVAFRGQGAFALRVNPLDTAWGRDDLALAAAQSVDLVVLPKVESPKQVKEVETLLAEQGSSAGLMAMIETPLGVWNAAAIASSSPSLVGLIAGTNDLSAALRIDSSHRPALEWSLSAIVVAARTAGLDAIDGVYNSVKDQDGFEAECAASRGLGFDGKTLIHPNQIEAANVCFRPSLDEVHAAQRVVEGFRAASNVGQGVAVVEGRMVEALHAEAAERTLTLHRMIEGEHEP